MNRSCFLAIRLGEGKSCEKELSYRVWMSYSGVCTSSAVSTTTIYDSLLIPFQGLLGSNECRDPLHP